MTASVVLGLALLSPSAPASDLPAPAPVAAAAQEAAAFTGSFTHIGGQAEQRALEEAIERAAEQLNFLIRGIGKRRLRAVTQIPTRVRYEIGSEWITMTYAGKSPVRAPADGRSIPWTDPQGKATRISFFVRDGVLVQRFIGEDGSRVNRVSLSDDGSRLTVRVTLRSDRLDDPLRYSLTYRRE